MHKTFLRDAKGKIVIGQKPNLLILGWAGFKISSMLVGQPTVKSGLAHTASALLFTWAYLEVTSGVNYLRITMGITVISAIIFGFFVR